MQVAKIQRSRLPFKLGGLALVVMTVAWAGLGCQREAAKAEPVVKTNAEAPTEPQDDDEAQEDDDEAQEDETGVLDKASDLLNQAKNSSGGSVNKATNWLKDQLDDATDVGSSTAQGTLDWANEMYQSLKDQGLTTAGSTSEWVAEDWKKMGAWEYKVVQLEDLSPIEIEKKLNELGKQRWECFHVMPLAGTQMYFKRPARSYLKNIPLQDMMRLIPMLDGSGE